jgi:hypothetical protein
MPVTLAGPDIERAPAALGRLLDVPYAEDYGVTEIGRLLELWEHEDPAAPRELCRALEASGLEPPDTEQLV